mgnify:CR=1 FL=1
MQGSARARRVPALGLIRVVSCILYPESDLVRTARRWLYSPNVIEPRESRAQHPQRQRPGQLVP